MDFRYSEIGGAPAGGYEQVLLDGMRGRPSLFWRADGIEASWRAVAPLLEVPEEEFNVMGTNVLALEPRRCLMLDYTPITRGRLEEAGCTVLTYKGVEISLKTEGGPTCLTRPILRDR